MPDGFGAQGALGVLGGDLRPGNVAEHLGRLSTADWQTAAAPLRAQRGRRHNARRLLDQIYAPVPLDRHLTDATTLCRCEGVTVGAIRQALDQGATGPNRVKTFTRCGMGPCQGRICGEAAAILAARALGSREQAGAWTARTPLRPVPMEWLVGDFDYADIPKPAPAPG